MVPRKNRAFELLEWVGSDKLTLVDTDRGWPSKFECKTRSGVVTISVYFGRIGLSHRGRDDVERRFQNPGPNCPVLKPKADEIPIMLGTTQVEKQPVVVGMDAHKRIGKLTRQSLFLPLVLLEGGAREGWKEHTSMAKERVVAFVPQLLSLFVDAYPNKRPVTDKEIAAALRAADAALPRSSLQGRP